LKPNPRKKRKIKYRKPDELRTIINIGYKLYVSYNMKLEEVGEIVGMPKGTVGRIAHENKWEADRKKLRAEAAAQLAKEGKDETAYHAGLITTETLELTQKKARDWAKEGEAHREFMVDMGKIGLKKADEMIKSGELVVKEVGDVDKLDKVVRRNLGLDAEGNDKERPHIRLNIFSPGAEKEAIDV
jgi:hypothetical protein